jgi:ABC-type transport system substrate-binding protein
MNGGAPGGAYWSAVVRGASVVLASAIVAACASTGGTSPGPGSKGDSGTLVVGVAGDYTAFDPCLGGTPQTTEVVASTYGYPVGFKTQMINGVFTQVADDTNAWVPQLAQSIDISPDYGTYTFHLRPGVKFAQTGDPMTAADWIWTFERDLSKPAIGFCSSDLANAAITSISQVKEVNNMTVQITVPAETNHLTLAYLRSVDFGIIDSVAAKKHATKADPWSSAWLATHSAGTGPFFIQSVSPGNEVVLARDPDYWGGPGGFSKIVLKVIPDLATRIALMQSGDLDMAEGIPPRQAQAQPGPGRAFRNPWSPIPSAPDEDRRGRSPRLSRLTAAASTSCPPTRSQTRRSPTCGTTSPSFTGTGWRTGCSGPNTYSSMTSTAPGSQGWFGPNSVPPTGTWRSI